MAATITRTETDHHELVLREYAALVSYCRRLDWDSPEDIAQEAAARTLKRLAVRGLDEITDIRAYLRATARHIRADIVRTRANAEIIVTDEIDLTAVEDPDVAEHLALRTGLELAMRKLNARELQAFQSSHIDEASTEQIAADMHMSIRATTSLLFRARQKVRTELERLKAKGLMVVGGPLGFFRQILNVFGGETAGAAAVAATAAAAVIAGTFGFGGTGDVQSNQVAAPSNRPATTIGSSDPGPAGSADARGGHGGNGTESGNGNSTGDRHDNGGGGGTPPTTQLLPIHPRAPRPDPVSDGGSGAEYTGEPIYVSVDNTDFNCDGAADVFYADNPWADEGGVVSTEARLLGSRTSALTLQSRSRRTTWAADALPRSQHIH